MSLNTLLAVPAELFHSLIFPNIDTNALAAITLVNKTMRDVVYAYDGRGHVQSYVPRKTIEKMKVEATALITKFPNVLLKLSVRQNNFDNVPSEFDVDKFVNNLLGYDCKGENSKIPTMTAKFLQNLYISGRNPVLNQLLQNCNEMYPSLQTLEFRHLEYDKPIRVQNSNTLKSIYIQFACDPVEVHLDNLPNLSEITLNVQNCCFPSSYEIGRVCLFDVVRKVSSARKTLFVTNVPNITNVDISAYNLVFDLTQLANLTEINLKYVNYIPDNNSKLFDIDFNQAFPRLKYLEINESGTVRNFLNWPPEPSTLCDLSNLNYLCMKQVWKMTAIGNLKNIESVAIIHNDWIESIGELTDITSITIGNCPNVTAIKSTNNVGEIYVSRCGKLDTQSIQNQIKEYNDEEYSDYE